MKNLFQQYFELSAHVVLDIIQGEALLCPYSHFEVRYGGRKVNVVTQDVKCGDKITPLD